MASVKREGKYWCDSEGNKWFAARYTQEQAQEFATNIQKCERYLAGKCPGEGCECSAQTIAMCKNV